jgi:hypothetical protein
VDPGGATTDSTIAVADSARTDARPIALVAAVKANVLNAPLLPMTTFMAVISYLLLSVKWVSAWPRAIKSFEMKSAFLRLHKRSF